MRPRLLRMFFVIALLIFAACQTGNDPDQIENNARITYVDILETSGGGSTPTPTPSPNPSPSPHASPTPTPSASPTPSPSATPTPSPSPSSSPNPPGTTSQLTQYGITWKFDSPVPYGQFLNGDYWVIGPVSIWQITPSSVEMGERTMHGSMINPSPDVHGLNHGYDSAMYGKYGGNYYKPGLNVALNVSASNVLVVPPDSSLVSTVSLPTTGARPQISTAAILTVLNTVPPTDSFRPPYSGADKTIAAREGDLDYSALQRLSLPGAAPRSGELANRFQRPWLDHVPGWLSRYTHPAENMPDYGRDIAVLLGEGAVLIHGNETNTQKRGLLINLMQIAIDLYGVARGAEWDHWYSGGAHQQGRIPFMILMGHHLNNSLGNELKNIRFNHPKLVSNYLAQTYYVDETTTGTYNYGFGIYSSIQFGLPEWGERHEVSPANDTRCWTGAHPGASALTIQGNKYRLISPRSMVGLMLAAHLTDVGAMDLYNDPESFDYIDRHMQEDGISYSAWMTPAWNQYRKGSGLPHFPVWDDSPWAMNVVGGQYSDCNE